ncbi:MAG: glycosyltransferase family 4 protein [Candidatus Hodarchaeota archaeon]
MNKLLAPENSLQRKIKICFFVGYFPNCSGGSEYQAYLLANALDPQKYEVFFISIGGNREGKYVIDGRKIFFLRTNNTLIKLGKYYFIYYIRIYKILYKERPQVIYQRIANSATGLLSYLSKKLRFKFILACASDPNVSKFRLSKFRHILANFDDLLRIYGISKAGTILVQSNDQKRMLKENFGRECYVVPNFHPKPENPIIKDKNSIKVTWVSNIKKLKQPEIFIDLAKEFRNHSEVKFVMIGRPAGSMWQKYLEERIKKLDNLEYLREQPNERINEILCRSHILVNTSKYEGFPNTFIQAWMRKVPVVSLNVDPDNILKNRKIGFHSKSFDQMILHVKKLIVDKNIREEMGERAQKYAYDKHTMKNIETVFNVIREK